MNYIQQSRNTQSLEFALVIFLVITMLISFSTISFLDRFSSSPQAISEVVSDHSSTYLSSVRESTSIDGGPPESGSNPVIRFVNPTLIDLKKDRIVDIVGDNFADPVSVLIDDVPYPSGLVTFINSTLIKMVVSKESPQREYSLAVRNSDNTKSNTVKVATGILPILLQITPQKFQNPSRSPIVNVSVWGEYFDQNAQVFIDNDEIPENLMYLKSKNQIAMSLPAAIVQGAKEVWVTNPMNFKSNVLDISKTTTRYPEIIDLSNTVPLQSDKSLVLRGNNFYGGYSELYLDDVLVDPKDYTVEHEPNGAFTLTLSLNSPALGTHHVYFKNPSNLPHKTLNPIQSNKLYFYVKNSLGTDVVFENSKIKLTFGGNLGTLNEIQSKDTGYTYALKNLFPWRIRYRTLHPTSQVWHKNPVITKDYFNPYKGNCLDGVEMDITRGSSSQSLTITWNDCEIDSENSFDFIKTYTLDDSSDYVKMSFSLRNNGITKYSLYSVRNYLTFVDKPSIKEYGLMSERAVESAIEPGHNLLTKGNQDLCDGDSRPVIFEQGTSCNNYPHEFRFTKYWYETDGDGFKIYEYAYNDIWGALWNDNGDYVYYLPEDDMTYAKGYNYQGDFGLFKNTVHTQVPNSFSSSNFDYTLPYSFRIGVGKGTTFKGKDTWINVADKFRETQRELFGHLTTPYAKRDVPEYLRNMDLHTVANLRGEFITGTTINPNPNIDEIVSVFRQSRAFFGAENSFLFVWGGNQDDTKALSYTPLKTTNEFHKKLNDAGWHPCFYTLGGGMYMLTSDPDYPAIAAAGDVAEHDPAGTKQINPGSATYPGTSAVINPSSVSLGSSDHSFLKWILKKYRLFNNNKQGARCFYQDGIYGNIPFNPANGIWSKKYNQNGYDKTTMKSLHNFWATLEKEIRKIDEDSFIMHEAITQLSTQQGGIHIQGTAGSTGKGGIITRDPRFDNKIEFYNRVYSGYNDFIYPNFMTSPNLVDTPYIKPAWYDTLKSRGYMPQSYDKTLAETFSLPIAVGVIIGGGIPNYEETGAYKWAGYTPVFDMQNAKQNPLVLDREWTMAMEHQARVVKEMVYARQLARQYFHGLWHLPLKTNSPVEDYYYILHGSLVANFDPRAIYNDPYPRVLTSVRQAWGTTDWAKKYGLLFYNTYQRAPRQLVTFSFEFDRYGVQPGTYDLFITSSGKGRRYLKSVTSDFTHTITIPRGTFVLLELEIQGDSDGDGVSNRHDRCPNTRTGKKVNARGCPLSSTTKFSPSISTNISKLQSLHDVAELNLGIVGKGLLSFRKQNVSLLKFASNAGRFESLDLEENIELRKNEIFLNATALTTLNVSAELTFYATGITSPLVYRNGVLYDNGKLKSFNATTKDVVIDVTGFSNYTVRQGTCGDKICGFTETKASCPSDCSITAVCGDNSCNGGETCSSCEQDCGKCKSGGGGGGGGGSSKVCSTGENRSCGSSVGECTFGTQTCSNNKWGPCQGGTQPTKEICDGKDNDCNARIDDGNVCSECKSGETKICGSSIGTCKEGTQHCVNGKWGDCEGGVLPQPTDICHNGLDDNCNGEIDESCDTPSHCSNGIKDHDETDIDCGGSCLPCSIKTGSAQIILYAIVIVIGGVLVAGYFIRKKR